MKDVDAVQMMQRCKEEILSMRRRINELEPKADAYDMMRKVLNLLPQPSQGMSEDIVWRLERSIAEITPKPETPDEMIA